MPVLVRHRAPMTAAQYDESAPALIALLKQQPGFVVHVAYEDAGGFVVAEIMGNAGAARQLVRRQREAEHPGRDHERGDRRSQRPHAVERPTVGVG